MDKSKTTSFRIEDVVRWKFEVWTLNLRGVLSAGSSSNLVKKLVSAIHNEINIRYVDVRLVVSLS